MNGTQIERLLELIDCNVSMTRAETASYILKHKDVIARDLAQKGSATIQTRAGGVQITTKDMERILESVSAVAA